MFIYVSYLSETGVTACLCTTLNVKVLNPPEIAFNTTARHAPQADIQILTLLKLVVNIPSKKNYGPSELKLIQLKTVFTS